MLTPVLLLDSSERWSPVGVEESLALHGYHWSTSTWAKDETHIEPGRKPGVDRLDFPPHMHQPPLQTVGYHELIVEEELFWHRFWFWYLYNSKQYLGTGAHEGDWEYVAFGCSDAAGDHPVLMTYSQHQSGGKAAAWECERQLGRPVAYVALGSHAHYFHRTDTLEDRADGRGAALRDITWREAADQPWWNWSGHWGNSTGEGKSPVSPGRQRRHPNLEWSRAR